MMKNKILAIITIGLIMICTGCTATTVGEAPFQSETSMFVQVEDTPSFRVVCHKETKVMYAVSKGGYHRGVFTLLVNADGSPMIYGG